ncbi:hypothetical protein H6F92_04005 [Microcystis wesenbergii FACHB-1317]|uniref:hypothetical protein n=1 Tax=Microcystis TaxID=1125 RepID=UPI001681A66D|nr:MULTISPECIES: hypothetical protein [Microcystis]MBD2288026.1 hypothetical protein [Microcystis wesenbergii FACHB-1317]UZO77181.1 hypothetical protein M8120_04040 [Microcystis aeruginosa str. Chao 1910]
MTTSESARYLMARTNLAFEHPELAASLVGLRHFRAAKKAQTITGQRVNLDL